VQLQHVVSVRSGAEWVVSEYSLTPIKNERCFRKIDQIRERSQNCERRGCATLNGKQRYDRPKVSIEAFGKTHATNLNYSRQTLNYQNAGVGKGYRR
jgi:hypothetical protein